jgi:hypothetical protein
VQHRASAIGVIMAAGQKAALGRSHAWQTVTVLVSETTLAIEFGDGDVRVIRRTVNPAGAWHQGPAAADR